MQIKLKVSAVTTPQVITADFKYNKDVAFCVGFDDSLVYQFSHAYKVFQGGVSGLDGVTYPGLTYSDGTGKLINYRGMFVTVGGDVGRTPTYMTWNNVREAVSNGWELSNHTAYQDRDQNNNRGPYMWDSLNNLLDAEKVIWDEVPGYRPVINTTPADDEGYMATAKALGYICHNSNTFEEKRDVVIYDKGNLAKFEEFMGFEPNGWFQLGRENFGDEYTPQNVQNNKNYIDDIFNRADGGERWMGNWFTHGPGVGNASAFVEVYNYIKNHPKNSGNDRVWVSSVSEFLQYLHVKDKSIISHNLVGDILTININQENIPENFRCRDMSLLISGCTVVSIEETLSLGSVTFNAVSGLVNIYNEDMSFAQSPYIQNLPAEIISLVADGNSVKIKYNKNISQSLVAAYTVNGLSVLEITGSGRDWVLNCSGPTIGKFLSYRMYNNTETYKGNAITLSNGVRVGDYINYPIAEMGPTDPEVPGLTIIRGMRVVVVTQGSDFNILTNQEQTASDVYYAGYSYKYGTTNIAVNGESIGAILNKKNPDLNLIYEGYAMPAYLGRPPYLRVGQRNRPYISFFNAPHLDYASDFYSTTGLPFAFGMVMEYLPGQDFEAFTAGGDSAYTGNIGSNLRVGDSSSGYAIPNTTLQYFKRSFVLFEFTMSTISVSVDGVFRGSIPNPGNNGLDSITRNSVGVTANNAVWNFYAMYHWRGSSYTDLINDKVNIQNNIINKWQAGEVNPNPHAYNAGGGDPEWTFNTTTRVANATPDFVNATSDQINSAQYRWYLRRPNNPPDGGNFGNQVLIASTKTINESVWSSYINGTHLFYVVSIPGFDEIKGKTKSISELG